MATNYSITRFTDWNPVKDNFEFKKPSKNKKGGLNINFNYLGSRLYLTVPKMRAPFGIGRGMNNEGYNLQLSFDRDNVQAQEFQSKCEEFDRTMVEYGMENAFEWGITSTKSKKPSREVVEDRYKAMVKYSKFAKTHPTRAGEVNQEYPPHILVGLPQSQGKEANPETGEPAVAPDFMTELYDRNKNLLPISEGTIQKNSRCSGLLYGNGWSTNSGFGVSWKAAQLMVFPRGGLPPKKCLIGEDLEEDDHEEFTAVDEEVEQEVEEGDAEEVEEGDAEEVEEGDAVEEGDPEEVEEEVEEVEEEVAKPAPKKRATATKKKA